MHSAKVIKITFAQCQNKWNARRGETRNDLPSAARRSRRRWRAVLDERCCLLCSVFLFCFPYFLVFFSGSVCPLSLSLFLSTGFGPLFFFRLCLFACVSFLSPSVLPSSFLFFRLWICALKTKAKLGYVGFFSGFSSPVSVSFASLCFLLSCSSPQFFSLDFIKPEKVLCPDLQKWRASWRREIVASGMASWA